MPFYDLYRDPNPLTRVPGFTRIDKDRREILELPLPTTERRKGKERRQFQRRSEPLGVFIGIYRVVRALLAVIGLCYLAGVAWRVM